MLRISIHAPRTGSDNVPGECLTAQRLFQSTLPARGATQGFKSRRAHARFQSTLPARGATVWRRLLVHRCGISIHAPRTGSDLSSKLVFGIHKSFQSTLPARGATSRQPEPAAASRFQSTLPARGATRRVQRLPFRQKNFNPRSPHGERRHFAAFCGTMREFQSTLPARGATRAFPSVLHSDGNFNPRSPHGERRWLCSTLPEHQHFNPRSPHGERRPPSCKGVRHLAFQSTLPARGATRSVNFGRSDGKDFNPRSPHGERPCTQSITQWD